MRPPLDELYFQWLYDQVASTRIVRPSKTFWGLLKQLYMKEFAWIVANDDNRLEDGKELRYEFVDQEPLVNVDPSWMHMGCSMLELLIGLSRRLAFMAEGEPRDWFWHFLDNLEIKYNDNYAFPLKEVDDALERVIWRTYNPSGEGGLFPLQDPREDQRKVELWYQLNAYVIEMG